ncbi:MAG: response regulator [Oscillochloris sp.]|nr:response regulator [Oscillochloris sp.]
MVPYTQPRPTHDRQYQPILPPNSDHLALRSSEVKPSAAARILVSEDNPGIQQIYMRLLPSYGFDVTCVEDGDGARTLELAREIRPHLVITDIHKPTMDGHALVAALHADPRTTHIPVLMVTAMDRRGEIQWESLAQANDYIVKPFPFDDLLYRITAMIDWQGLDHDSMVERAIALPCYNQLHPATGLPCLHHMAAELPLWSDQPGWLAFEISFTNHRLLLDTYGHPVVNGLASSIRVAISRSLHPDLLVGHTSFDLSIAVIGPAAQVAEAEALLIERFANLSHFQSIRPAAPAVHIWLRHADDRAGLRLGLRELRAALH